VAEKGSTVEVSRDAVLAFRLRRHQLTGDRPADPAEVAILDFGVQDTGTDGAAWALRNRTAEGTDPTITTDRSLLAWTIRGAPHAYRRSDLPDVAVATAPFSDADAASRVFDAAKAFREAGIPVLDALRDVASAMRRIVTAPMAKGELSGRLTGEMAAPFLRQCRPCQAVHLYEQTFRLAALQAGLELVPGTSPPELRPVEGVEPPMLRRLGADAGERFHVLRNHLRFYGPATVADTAKFLDAPIREVKAHWPEDVVEVAVVGGGSTARFALDADVDDLTAAGSPAGTLLLGPFDPYLQLRDRALLVPDEAARKDLWRTLGRPGAVLVDGEVRGSWRPRAKGRRFEVAATAWSSLTARQRSAVEAEAARLADHRGLTLTGVTWA
jgi:hypothetical protein